MAVFTILVDRREQKPWLFENYPVDTKEVTLETGDYTIAELCEYNDEYDTYVPSLAVERKSGPDLLQSITHGHDRFRREIVRAEDWDEPLQIYVEEPWGTFMNNRKFMDYRDVSRHKSMALSRPWEGNTTPTSIFTRIVNEPSKRRSIS